MCAVAAVASVCVLWPTCVRAVADMYMCGRWVCVPSPRSVQAGPEEKQATDVHRPLVDDFSKFEVLLQIQTFLNEKTKLRDRHGLFCSL